MKRFAEQCVMLSGQLPRAQPWPASSRWMLRKGELELDVICAQDQIISVAPEHLHRQFAGRRFVTLLHHLGDHPGTLNVQLH